MILHLSVNTPKLSATVIMSFAEGWLETKEGNLAVMEIEMRLFNIYLFFCVSN